MDTFVERLTALWVFVCSLLAPVRAWAIAHPEIAGPIVGSLVVWVLKPRTAEQYARIAGRRPTWLWSRVAAFLQLLGAIFIDVPKAQKVAWKLLTGRSEPPPSGGVTLRIDEAGISLRSPKSPEPGDQMRAAVVRAGLVLVAIGALLFGVAFSGCKPAAAPREQARSVVLLVTEAVRVADLTCASIGEGKHDEALLERCARASAVAKHALAGAADIVDGWEQADAGELGCAVALAADALTDIVRAIREAGGKPPQVVEDALRHAPILTVACRG